MEFGSVIMERIRHLYSGSIECVDVKFRDTDYNIRLDSKREDIFVALPGTRLNAREGWVGLSSIREDVKKELKESTRGSDLLFTIREGLQVKFKDMNRNGRVDPGVDGIFIRPPGSKAKWVNISGIADKVKRALEKFKAVFRQELINVKMSLGKVKKESMSSDEKIREIKYINVPEIKEDKGLAHAQRRKGKSIVRYINGDNKADEVELVIGKTRVRITSTWVYRWTKHSRPIAPAGQSDEKGLLVMGARDVFHTLIDTGRRGVEKYLKIFDEKENSHE